jgi:signal transduction histidine kinase/ActR/RegA family two-component response regulator
MRLPMSVQDGVFYFMTPSQLQGANGPCQEDRLCLQWRPIRLRRHYRGAPQGLQDNTRCDKEPIMNSRPSYEELQQRVEMLEKERHLVQQAHKLEAIGTLAGGIAHDFNNILWIISGNTEMAMAEIARNHPVYSNLKRIEEACQRAHKLVMQILNFSRQTEQECKPLKISAVIKETIKLLRASLPATIEIRHRLLAESSLVMADLAQINQVLMNLCTNAAHAMRETGGVMEIHLEAETLGNADHRLQDDLGPGNYVRLQVSDTGCGMASEVVDRIFDPFFSTKAVNEGTGMGLSVVHGIVKAHGGAIRVKSRPGKGTQFSVYLPIHEEVQVKPMACTEAMAGGRKETVLLVDDEELILEVGEQMLKRLGYEVETCAHPVKALSFFKADPTRYHAVITDQGMPAMSGLNLARECKAIDASVPIVLCTGFSDMVSEANEADRIIDAFLMKPIVMGQLAETLRRLLNQDKP